MRFRRFARHRLRRLGLLAILIAVTAPVTALAHDDDDGPDHRRVADLSLTLTGSPNPVQGDNPATFTLTATNAGPNAARRVRAAIVLTGPREITRVDGVGWSCEIADATAECTRRSMRSGSSSSIAIVAIAPRGFGRIGAGAAITSRTDDPARANNGAERQVDVNNPPVVNPDDATTTAGVLVDIPVLENDADPDGDQLTFTGTPTSEQGAIDCDELVCAYTSRAGFVGTDRFVYTVSDGRGASGSAEVTVLVNPISPPPPGPTQGPGPGPPLDPTSDPRVDTAGNSGPGVSVGGPPNVVEGQTAPYTVTIVNTCTVVAKQVLLRLRLPAGAIVVSAPSRSVLKGRTLSVPIGNVRAGKPRRVGVRLRFRANGGSLRTIVASVTAANGRLAGDGIVIAVRPR